MNAIRCVPSRCIFLFGIGLTVLSLTNRAHAQGAAADSSAPARRDTVATPAVAPTPARSDSIVIPPPTTSAPGTPLPAAPAPVPAPTPVSLKRGTADPAACASGEKDAQLSNAPVGYTIAGVFTGPIALTVAWLGHPSSPKTTDLSTDAGREYSRCYGNAVRKRNVKGALNGWAAGAMLFVIGIWYADSATAP
jgi:hypothetical protein